MSKFNDLLKYSTTILAFMTAVVSLLFIVVDKGVFVSDEGQQELKKFEGTWVGSLNQSNNTDYIQYPSNITIVLDRQMSKLKGELDFNLRPEEKGYISDFKVEAVNKKQEFLKMDYWCSSKDCVSFGTIILEINGLRNEMKGTLVGYGATSQQIVDGKVTLAKTN